MRYGQLSMNSTARSRYGPTMRSNWPRRSRTPCSTCFIRSRSGIANSYNDNPAPAQDANVRKDI